MGGRDVLGGIAQALGGHHQVIQALVEAEGDVLPTRQRLLPQGIVHVRVDLEVRVALQDQQRKIDCIDEVFARIFLQRPPVARRNAQQRRIVRKTVNAAAEDFHVGLDLGNLFIQHRALRLGQLYFIVGRNCLLVLVVHDLPQSAQRARHGDHACQIGILRCDGRNHHAAQRVAQHEDAAPIHAPIVAQQSDGGVHVVQHLAPDVDVQACIPGALGVDEGALVVAQRGHAQLRKAMGDVPERRVLQDRLVAVGGAGALHQHHHRRQRSVPALGQAQRRTQRIGRIGLDGQLDLRPRARLFHIIGSLRRDGLHLHAADVPRAVVGDLHLQVAVGEARLKHRDGVTVLRDQLGLAPTQILAQQRRDGAPALFQPVRVQHRRHVLVKARSHCGVVPRQQRVAVRLRLCLQIALCKGKRRHHHQQRQ